MLNNIRAVTQAFKNLDYTQGPNYICITLTTFKSPDSKLKEMRINPHAATSTCLSSAARKLPT
jgi:hypothetical protein